MSGPKIDPATIQALAIDMDGVLWRGSTPLPGFLRLFSWLESRGLPYMLLTNNASKTVEQYVERFAGHGATVPGERILSSAVATGTYLAERLQPGAEVFVIGGPGLRSAVESVGLRLRDDPGETVAAVAVGLDLGLTYDKLRDAVLLIQRGARFVGSNGDRSFPVERGFYPGAGSILAAIQSATGQQPEVVGKPEPPMFEVAAARLNVPRSGIVMIGDRLETDILGGRRAGFRTVLVTSGIDDEASIERLGIQPDAVASGIDRLVDSWQS